MVRAMEEEEESSKSSRLGRFRGMLESGASKFRRSLNENNGPVAPSDEDNDRMTAKSNASAPLNDDQNQNQNQNQSEPPPALQPRLGGVLSRTDNVRSRASDGEKPRASDGDAKPRPSDGDAKPRPSDGDAKPPSPPPPKRRVPTGNHIHYIAFLFSVIFIFIIPSIVFVII